MTKGISNGVNKGFTLVEMIVYIATLVLVVGTVAALLVWLLRTNSQVHIRSELVVNMEQALSLLHSEVREAQSAYTPTSVWGSHPGQLSLETRKNPPLGETSTYVDFFLCDTRLCLKRESQQPLAFTSANMEIQRLEFTEIQTGSAPSVHVIIEASRRGITHSMETTVSLRTYE